jgi:hypothetical protein
MQMKTKMIIQILIPLMKLITLQIKIVQVLTTKKINKIKEIT